MKLNLFQDEAEDSNVKKEVFVSPFKRYKCVIPMIAEQEAKELEKQKRSEEETVKNEEETHETIENEEGKHKTVENEEEKHVTVKKGNLKQAEIDASINRVYEHYKKVSQLSNEGVQNVPKKKKKKKKKKQVQLQPLSQMPGRKRKRESDITNESESQGKNSDNSFSTPTPSLDTRIVHLPKKMKKVIKNAVEQQKLQQTLAQVQGNKNSETVKSMR